MPKFDVNKPVVDPNGNIGYITEINYTMDGKTTYHVRYSFALLAPRYPYSQRVFIESGTFTESELKQIDSPS